MNLMNQHLKNLIKNGSLDDIKKYIENNNYSLTRKDEAGWGYLYNAAYRSNPDIAKYLIEKGVDTHLTSKNGLTSPLMIAIHEGNTRTSLVLIKNNVPLGSANISGKNPLEFVIYHNQVNVAEAMLFSDNKNYLGKNSKQAISNMITNSIHRYSNDAAKWNRILNILNGTMYGRGR